MSGGSFNYAYQHLDEMIESMQRSEIPERRAFGEHLVKVQKAMRGIEWIDSGDTKRGDEIPLIHEVLGIDAEALIAGVATERLRKEIERAVDVLKTIAPWSVPDRP